MKRKIVSKRYANALLMLAQNIEEIEIYSQELNRFLNVFENNPRISLILLSPTLANSIKKEILKNTAEALGLSDIIKKFLYILIDKKRIKKLKEIAESYRELADEELRIIRVTIQSATDIDRYLIEEIKNRFERILKKKVILNLEIKPELIGGLVAKVKDLIIDGSIKGQLLRITERMELALGEI